MKCTLCGTNVDREATDRGICFDCYCQLDMEDYEAHLRASRLEFEAVPSAAGLANKRHCPQGEEE
jgi:hypothetical protein